MNGNQRNGSGNGSQNNLNSGQESGAMHVFVNSHGAAGNALQPSDPNNPMSSGGGKFVAASQQYLQELARN